MLLSLWLSPAVWWQQPQQGLAMQAVCCSLCANQLLVILNAASGTGWCCCPCHQGAFLCMIGCCVSTLHEL
jgi:hypothetical protein